MISPCTCCICNHWIKKCLSPTISSHKSEPLFLCLSTSDYIIMPQGVSATQLMCFIPLGMVWIIVCIYPNDIRHVHETSECNRISMSVMQTAMIHIKRKKKVENITYDSYLSSVSTHLSNAVITELRLHV